MSIWLVRAGSNGEYETKFLDDKCIYLTWDGFNRDMSKYQERKELIDDMNEVYPDVKAGSIRNWGGQVWVFGKRIEINDWVILPSKKRGSINIGRVTGEYEHLPEGPDPYFHRRTVDWFATDIPRSNFDQDLLYSFGAFMTICRITRNDAESRIKAMAENDWQSTITTMPELPSDETSDDEESTGELDIERFSKDQIAKVIAARFSGHKMANLVEAILKAQGYYTYRSPEGPDKGVDLLAAQGTMGFTSPKICVQVKSGSTPIDRPTLDQLLGTMVNFKAEYGLLVSWGGFKTSVDKELPSKFFEVRLWDQDQLIEELLQSYDELEEEIKSELPLKRIWAIAFQD